jgi:membrane associated rhomboid family serine protease
MIPLRDVNTRTGRRPGRPIVTVALIVLNALFFFYELALGDRGLEGFLLSSAFVPARLGADGLTVGDLGHGLSSALLSMFLHGGWLHFLGNMLFLWIFGDNVEDRLGHGRFVAFYLLAGYAAALAHFLANPASTAPAIGASGAISGVLGAYLFLHPGAGIQTLIFLGFFVRVVTLPAWLYLPFWFFLQLLPGLSSLGATDAQQAGGVAWFAHIGGFVAGPILLLLLGGQRRGAP